MVCYSRFGNPALKPKKPFTKISGGKKNRFAESCFSIVGLPEVVFEITLYESKYFGTTKSR
jgi:hypothetical protein